MGPLLSRRAGGGRGVVRDHGGEALEGDAGARVELAHELVRRGLDHAEQRLVGRHDRGAEVAHRFALPRHLDRRRAYTRGPPLERLGGEAGAVVLDQVRLPCHATTVSTGAVEESGVSLRLCLHPPTLVGHVCAELRARARCRACDRRGPRLASTVFGLMNAAPATSRFVIPDAASSATRRSVAVSSSGARRKPTRSSSARVSSAHVGAPSLLEERESLGERVRGRAPLPDAAVQAALDEPRPARARTAASPPRRRRAPRVRRAPPGRRRQRRARAPVPAAASTVIQSRGKRPTALLQTCERRACALDARRERPATRCGTARCGRARTPSLRSNSMRSRIRVSVASTAR